MCQRVCVFAFFVPLWDETGMTQGSPTSCLSLLFPVCCSPALPSRPDLWQEGGVPSSPHLWILKHNPAGVSRNPDSREGVACCIYFFPPQGGSRGKETATQVKSLDKDRRISTEWDSCFTELKLLLRKFNVHFTLSNQVRAQKSKTPSQLGEFWADRDVTPPRSRVTVNIYLNDSRTNDDETQQ